jgi:hypothetical protein
MEQLGMVLVLIWDEFCRLNQHIHLHQDQYLYQESPDSEAIAIENRFTFTLRDPSCVFRAATTKSGSD